MKKTLLIFNVILTLFWNCSNNDVSKTDSTILPPEMSLKGNWNMTSLQGGFAGVQNNFTYGDIIWTFNDADFTLTVNNNLASGEIISGLMSGVYNYSTITNNGELFLIIENTEFGHYLVTSNGLILNQTISTTNDPVSDGMIMTFER